MNRPTPFRILACCLALGLVACASFAAIQREAALGTNGELFQVRVGTYGELFPDGKELIPATNPVLALDVVRPGELMERLLVPGTELPDAEGSPYLLVEGSSNTVFLVWEIRINAVHSILKLASFNGSWSTPIQIGKNPSSLKAAPQFAITHDTYTAHGENGNVLRHRTVLHLVWAEEEDSGNYATRYSPVVLDQGVQIGSTNMVYDLNDYKAEEGFEQSATTPDDTDGWSSLVRTPTIQSGRDDRTVVVAFGDPATRRLISLEIDSLPAELSRLADETRAQIVDLGAKGGYPGQLEAFVAQVQSRVLELGKAFHPEVGRAIADRVVEVILEGASKRQDLVPLADDTRAQIVDLGAKLSGRGLRNSQAASTSVREIAELPLSADGSAQGQGSPPSHLIQFRLASSRPFPDVGTQELRIFVSESGEQLILGWLDNHHVRYRSTRDQGDGWTDARELALAGGLDLQKAYKILEQRVRSR